MKPKIIFKDEQLLVLNKPAGIVVNRATTAKTDTIQDWIALNFQFPIAKDQSMRSGIVHRLDKETSGILLIAKTPEAFFNLQKQFKERRVEKRYLALVHDKVEPKKGEIRAPVGRLPWQREKFGVMAGGREARSKYKVISNWSLVIDSKKEEFSFLELKPETGRTHQLRVHLKYWGHPIVADDKYAGRKTSRRDRKWCPRLFLHAGYLSFAHPITGKRKEFVSELPFDLQRSLKLLTKITEHVAKK